MTIAFEHALVEPLLAEWRCTRTVFANSWLQVLRDAARRRLVQTAGRFSCQLSQKASSVGFLPERNSALSGDPDQVPIIMTGHQPVIFHSGLTFKYATTETFAARKDSIGIAVVVDTDTGDAGAFSFPEREETTGNSAVPLLRTSTATFGQSTSLFAVNRKKSPEAIRREATRVATALAQCGCTDSALRFQTVAQQYAQLPGDSMLEANLITRREAGIGRRLEEIPLSVICGFPEVVQFFARILEQPFEFAQCCNETLTQFRVEHRIRNEANPFPALQVRSDQCEMPFWLIDQATGTRSGLLITRDAGATFLGTSAGTVAELPRADTSAAIFSLLIAGKQLVPRGALITAVLRLLFSDLFVHGTGGGRYDQYTDTLIRKWWKVEPTPFSVASASRFLFPELRQEFERLQRIVGRLRDLQFNPSRYYGSGIFSSEQERSLRTLIAAKQEAVNRLKAARQAGESGQEAGTDVQQLSDAVKEAVANMFAPQTTMMKELSPQTIAAITSRLWPWMFFNSPTEIKE